MQPRGERSVAAELGKTTVGPDKGVLRDFLRVRMIAQHGKSDREHALAVASHDLDESRFVAGVVPAHQFDIDQRLVSGGGSAVGARGERGRKFEGGGDFSVGDHAAD